MPNLNDQSVVSAAPSFREWIVSLSFANVFYLRTWAALLQEGRNITPTAHLMGVVNVLLLALCFRWGYALIARSTNASVKRFGHVVIAGLLLIPFHAITTIYFSDDPLKRNVVYAAALLMGASVIVSRHARSIGWCLLLVVVPFIVVTFGQSLWRAATYDGSRWDVRPFTPVNSGRTSRLLWIIFDEWDYGLTFEARPQWLRTPELDRLYAVSFHASHAISPGPKTDISMPRLLTGDKSANVKRLSFIPTIFSRAKGEGFRSAVSGWHINYCGALSNSMAECWSTNMDAERNSMGLGPTEIATNQLKYLFESQFRSPFGQSIGTKRHILDYSIILRGALKMALNPAFNLIFVHFPIPHPPLFYDRTTGRYDLGDRPLVGLVERNTLRYLDGLELVDHTIAQIRRTLESVGLWDRTHLIVSSDHPARSRERIDGISNDRRVPFIVRVAGTSQEIAYKPVFNTIVSSDLAIALLRGEIHSPAEVRSKIEDDAGAGRP